MLDVVSVKQCQFHSDADAVVSTKGSAFGAEPFAVDVCLDRVIVKVYVALRKLLAHHVHVALENYSVTVFVSRGRIFTDENVASLIYDCLKSTAFTKLFKESNNFLLAF